MTALSDLVAAGSVLTMPDGYRAILADAAVSGRELWWFETYGREHFVTFDSAKEADGWLQFYRGGERVASVGALEGADDEAAWIGWKDFLQTDEGRAAARAIAEMKTDAADQPD
jgi:hypothetical protein